VIRGLEAAAACLGVQIYHAGTSFGADGEVLATGGRVLNVVGVGEDVAKARERVYLRVNYIGWKDQIWRADLGGTT
jgi:phosphoribosylamine--glycine ligase